MNFAERPPSVAWEPINVPYLPGCVLWGWVKPAQAPLDIMIQVPAETFSVFGPALTLRGIIAAAGVDPVQIVSWTILGRSYEGQGGASPLLDQPFPFPGPHGIAVRIAQGSASPLPMGAAPSIRMTAMPAPGSPASGDALFTLEAIDAEWQTIIQIERQLEAVRRKLGDVQGQLGSLNRDLGSDERLYSNAQEKKDWDDARRFLRDNLAQVGRYIRAHDIGVTSTAGNRKHLANIFDQFVEPKQAFPGMEAEQLAYEQHRKTSQTLLLQMQTAHAAAARDGVQRSRSVLTRIAAKVQLGRNKR